MDGVWLNVTLCAAGFVIGALLFGFIMFKVGIEHRRKTAEAQIESAEKEANRIITEANEKAQATKKTALLRSCACHSLYDIHSFSVKKHKCIFSSAFHRLQRFLPVGTPVSPQSVPILHCLFLSDSRQNAA